MADERVLLGIAGDAAVSPEEESISESVPESAEGTLTADVHHSLRNAAKLGLSLLATWVVALGVRMYLPRSLGPASFGAFQFADAYTGAVFVLLNLGLETYTRKEIPTRREHAADFFGGTLIIRLVLSAVAMTAAVAGVAASGKPELVVRLVATFGLYQVLYYINGTYAAMLHAAAAVDELSVLNIGTKLAWGAGIVVALVSGGGVESVALAMLGAETIRLIGLAVLTRKHLALKFRVDFPASFSVLRASLPFYMTLIVRMAYARIDISVMSFLTTDTEVGWYGAAATIAGIAFLMSPLIEWVVSPLTSRAVARSDEALMRVSRRGMEVVLAIAIPSALALDLGAHFIIPLAFGAAYLPAVRTMQILAWSIVLTYAAMFAATILIRLERGWTVTAVLAAGLLLSPPMNIVLIPRCLALFGPGGAGIGAATTLIATEFVTTVPLFWVIGRRAFDRRLVIRIGKTLAVSVAVVALDHVLLFLGPVRLLIDAAAYVALIVASGAVDVGEISRLAREALAARRLAAAAS